MADYYQMFSEVVPAITAEQRAWIERVLGDEDDPEFVLKESGFDMNAIDLDDWPGFEWEFNTPENELWLHGDECGNVNHVGELIRAFLAQFAPDQCWQLTWAETCSKARVGAFGGGGLFVTARKVKICRAADWADQQRQQFEQAGGTSPS